MVIIKADGQVIATGDLTAPPIARPPTLADMRRACMEVTADIAASQAADAIMQPMAQAAANNAAELQAAQIRANLERRRSGTAGWSAPVKPSWKYTFQRVMRVPAAYSSTASWVPTSAVFTPLPCRSSQAFKHQAGRACPSRCALSTL